MTVTSTMVDAIATTNAGIRNLGDAEGGHEDTLRRRAARGRLQAG